MLYNAVFCFVMYNAQIEREGGGEIEWTYWLNTGSHDFRQTK